jgi:hypothetical protein
MWLVSPVWGGDLGNKRRAVLAPLLPAQPVRGGQWREHQQVINAIWIQQA